jgi:hypothetical protein
VFQIALLSKWDDSWKSRRPAPSQNIRGWAGHFLTAIYQSQLTDKFVMFLELVDRSANGFLLLLLLVAVVRWEIISVFSLFIVEELLVFCWL